MQYDASVAALIHPERRPFLGLEGPWNDAARLAECARLAYFRFEDDAQAAQALKEALTAFGYRDFIGFFANGRPVGTHWFDTQAYGAISGEGTALVAFRGTQPESFLDALADASFLPTRWTGVGLVHNGFWASLQDVLPDIEAWLGRVGPSRLIVTGHSLGAAQATLLAGIRTEAELVTFGSPLVGDAEFAASFSGRTMKRYVDCLDLVTRVPPHIYRHLDGLNYIDRHGVVRPDALDLIDGIEERGAAGLAYLPLAIKRGNCWLRDFADHAPINYVSALLGIREGP